MESINLYYSFFKVRYRITSVRETGLVACNMSPGFEKRLTNCKVYGLVFSDPCHICQNVRSFRMSDTVFLLISGLPGFAGL